MSEARKKDMNQQKVMNIGSTKTTTGEADQEKGRVRPEAKRLPEFVCIILR